MLAQRGDANLNTEYAANKVKDSGVTDEVIDRMKVIAQALTNKELMKKALKGLSDDMLALYKDKLGTAAKAADFTQALSKTDRPEDEASRHILTQVLTTFEEANGFKTFASVNGHPRIIQMTGTVSGPGFLSTVGAGHMAKDYVTLEHGVYTHRIQWYCLHRLQQAGSINLANNFGELYKQFQSGNAWLITFDRLLEHDKKATGAGVIHPFDFRTPEKLHDHLKTADALSEAPMVAAYMQKKTAAIGKITNWITVKRVTVARKLFPAKSSQLDGWKALPNASEVEKKLKIVLSPEELKQLDEVVIKGKATNDDANLMTPGAGGVYRSGGPNKK